MYLFAELGNVTVATCNLLTNLIFLVNIVIRPLFSSSVEKKHHSSPWASKIFLPKF